MLAAAVLLTACVRSGFTSPPTPASLQVIEAVYPLYPAWNDYIKNDNGGTSRLDQPDEGCLGDEPGPHARCIHSGVLRRVVLEGIATCAGLAARDALEAFTWICREQGDQAVLYTVGLQPGVGLARLLTANAFRPNWVEVRRDGQVVARTDEGVWWDNPVLPLPDNGGPTDRVATLELPGAIYVLDSDRETNGYNINADRVAVVVQPGAALTLRTGAENSCNIFTGETAPPSPPDDQELIFWRPAILCAGGQRFLWLEGELHNPPIGTQPEAYDTGVALVQCQRSQLRQLSTQGGGYGVLLYGSSSNLVADVRSSNNLYYGMIVGAGWGGLPAQYNTVTRLSVASAGGGSGGNAALLVGQGANDNVFTQLLLAHAPHGLFQYDAGNHNNRYSHTTTASCINGIRLEGSSNTMLVQAVSTNNAEEGISLSGSVSDSRLAHLVAAHNGGSGIAIAFRAVRTVFSGSVLVGDNASGDCVFCDLGATLVVTDISLAHAFIGAVAGDGRNRAATGVVDYGAIDDWLHFESSYRGWGAVSAGFPDTAAVGRCVAGSRCQIWDWRLAESDRTLVDRSGDGAAANDPFVAGQPCPAAAHGDRAITDAAGTATFLINATELFFDGIGNEDGLCESNEACLYSPHLGAYQGEGSAVNASCAFEDGAISGVTLYARGRTNP